MKINSLRALAIPILGIGLFVYQQQSFADNSLGQRDNLDDNINVRQKAELAIPPGFVEGSTFKGILRNSFFERNNHHTPSGRDQREWAQGGYLSFRSGYTDTPLIGFGVDVHSFYALKLDGGGGHGGAGLMPRDSEGKPESNYSTLGGALKIRGFDSLVQAGDQLLDNPVIASGVSRMFPQTYRGVSLMNYTVDDLTLDAGWVDSTRLRNQSGQSHLKTSYGGSNRAGVEAHRASSHMDWGGGVYSAPKSVTVTAYAGNLSDVWNQYYLGSSYPFSLAEGVTLTPYLHYFDTRDQGDSHLGRINNQTYTSGLTLAGGGQSLTFGFQKVDGDTPFDYVIQNDGSYLYLSNSMQYADFNGPHEKSWKVQYQTSLAFINAPSFKLSTSYTRGKAYLTRGNPNSAGYGYIYNPDGKNARHWERDVSLRYEVPDGKAKGTSVTLRWAVHRSGKGYTAPGNTRGNADADEYRVIVDYPFTIF